MEESKQIVIELTEIIAMQTEIISRLTRELEHYHSLATPDSQFIKVDWPVVPIEKL